MPDPAIRDERPAVLIPYSAPDPAGASMDIFIYLRPETNGVRVESSLLKTIRSDPRYHRKIELVYLANIPGSFILKNHIVEIHYATRLHFAALGPAAFTESMKRRFEAYFQIPFERAKILSAFDALRELGYQTEELFRLWVDPSDILILNGQNIKRKGDIFIVNYDIPALLHKNTYETDVAAMIFRVTISWDEFRSLIGKIVEALTEDGVLDPSKPPERVFHYSKSPFEQLIDAAGYLYGRDGLPVPKEQVSFARFLQERGVGSGEIDAALGNPIMTFDTPHGPVEEHIVNYTLYSSYEEAYRKLRSRTAYVTYK